jgi:ADP-ribosyl-[dinitrogen reductase] hydrolase
MSTDRRRAGIYGLLIGDALGVPYEFQRAEDIGEVVWGAPTHRAKPGTWSDDGSLALALLDSLCSAGFDTDDQARRFLAWADTGAYTPHGEGKFDIGTATAAAFARLRRGVPAEEAGADPDAQGNGSLMRILPLALVDPPDDAAELIDRAHRSSAITHGAPECLAACAVYVLIARRLADGERDRPSAIASAFEAVEADYRRRADANLLAALETLRSHAERRGRGWVIDSFWSAWDAFANHETYGDALVAAVEYGNDTDTTAAIAGGLGGLYWGLDEATGGIPRVWLDGLRDRPQVEALWDRCAGAA